MRPCKNWGHLHRCRIRTPHVGDAPSFPRPFGQESGPFPQQHTLQCPKRGLPLRPTGNTWGPSLHSALSQGRDAPRLSPCWGKQAPAERFEERPKVLRGTEGFCMRSRRTGFAETGGASRSHLRTLLHVRLFRKRNQSEPLTPPPARLPAKGIPEGALTQLSAHEVRPPGKPEAAPSEEGFRTGLPNMRITWGEGNRNLRLSLPVGRVISRDKPFMACPQGRAAL